MFNDARHRAWDLTKRDWRTPGDAIFRGRDRGRGPRGMSDVEPEAETGSDERSWVSCSSDSGRRRDPEMARADACTENCRTCTVGAKETL